MARRPTDVPAEEAPPDPGRAPGVPHPRETAEVIGHAAARQGLTDTVHSGLILAGPLGVGKATLAYAHAAALRAGGDAPADHPVRARIRARAEPGLHVVERAWNPKAKRHRARIGVDEARGATTFLRRSLPDGGARVVLVDAADEMTPEAQNALLKTLEEPPAGARLILVAHRPARLLPTIRSRCAVIRLGPLGPEDTARALAAAGLGAPPDLVALAEGSPGAAARLAAEDGPALYGALVRLVSAHPMDRGALLALTGTFTARTPERGALALRLLSRLLGRAARAPLVEQPETVPGEGRALARLAPDLPAARAWAALQPDLIARAEDALAVNLDPAAVLSDTLLAVGREAARIAARRDAS